MRNFKVFAAMAMAAGMFASLPLEAGLIPEANAPVLYGLNTQSTTGTNGFGSFAARDGKFDVMPGSEALDINSCVYQDGKLYVLRTVSNWWTGDSYHIDVYNTDTWEQLSTHQIEGVSPQSGRGMAINADGTKLYLITAARDEDYNLNYYLTAVDLTTYELENAIQLPGWYYYHSVCAGKDADTFFVFSSDLLLEANTATQAVTELCRPDVDINSFNMSYDAQSGKLYFMTTGGDQLLHAVCMDDPKTGAVTDLGPVEGLNRMFGLTVPTYKANVPDAVTNVCFDYAAPGSLESTLTFEMPALTFGGEALSGTVKAIVDIDGEVIELSGEPGKSIELNRTLANGMHLIKILASDDNGLSPERRFHTFAGIDAPGAVANIDFSIDEEGNAAISWEAPVKSAQGGTFDKNDLTYTVVRYPGGVTVARGIKEQNFKENLGDAFGNYYYTITPSASGLEGVEAATPTIKSGSINVPPFTEGFDNWDDFGRWTIENPLDNYYGWNIMSGGAMCSISTGETSDYYLFSPQIRLQADKTYTLSFDCRLNGWGEGYADMDVYICRAPESSADATMLIKDLRATDHDGITYFSDFKIEEDGIYYLCFHNITPPDGMSCEVRNIGIDINSSLHAPAAVADLSAFAGGKGVLTATLSFTVPVTNADGTQNNSIDKVEIWNETNGNHITFQGVAPGASLVWTDDNAQQGVNTYGVAAYAAGEKGMTAHISQFVGIDIPGAVESVKVTTADGINTISWTAPSETGKNGGYVDVASLKYNVYFKEDPTGYYMPQIGTEVEGFEFTHDSFMLPEDTKQKVVSYIVKPVCNGEEGLENSRLYTMGEAYAMPYADSFSGTAYQTEGWISTLAEGKAAWSLANGNTILVKPSDLDGGMLQFVNNGLEGASASLRSPKILLGKDSRIGFDMYHGSDVEPGDMTLTVILTDNEGNEKEIATVDFNDGTEGWNHHIIDLGSFETPEEHMVVLKGFAYDSSASLFIDNIDVARGYAVDAALLNLTVPQSASRGDIALVKVLNAGKETASFDVVLFKNDGKVAVSAIENLEAGASAVVEMDMCIAPDDAMTTVTYRAQTMLDGDMNADNDSSQEAEVFVKRNTIPTVEIEGETSSANEVMIQWEPAATSMAVDATDDFESYSPYALDFFGGWRTLDVDGKQTTFSKFWTAITNAYAPMAFEVWNNAQATEDGFFDFGVNADTYRAHSGESMLIAFTAIESSFWGDSASDNDNWLFSPEVLGGTDVSFFVKGTSSTETIEIYATSEDVDFTVDCLDKFELLASYEINETDWREITFVLPADAVRFAVRHTSSYGNLLMLDDFTFVPAEGSKKEVSVTGYNIYRDGEQIASITECEYTDKPVGGQHVYFVTTMTDAGESAASNPFYADIALGVAGVADGVSVKGTDGCIIVITDTATECNVYSASGMTLFSGTVNGVKRIGCPAGVYAVVIDGNTYKVAVK